jgi:hypothetical protein
MELNYAILIGVISAFSILLLIVSLKFLPSIGISPIAVISVFFTLILFTGIIACLYLISKLITKLDKEVNKIEEDVGIANTNASTALQTANAVSGIANQALTTSIAADANATTALQTANGVAGVANTALINSTTANTNASTALQTANAISGVAFSAFNTANTAINIANTAAQKVDEMKDDVDTLKDNVNKVEQDILIVSTEMIAANVKLDATKQAFNVIFDAINIEKYQGSSPEYFRYDETVQDLSLLEENPV